MRKALLVVDVQQDFCEGGTMGVDGGNDVAENLSRWIENGASDYYDYFVFSKDWHLPKSSNGGHIVFPPEQPDFVDTWPSHCIQGTDGAKFHPAITRAYTQVIDKSLIVYKGMGEPAYSAFQGRVSEIGDRLSWALTERSVDRLDVCGIATDYCVKESVLDATRLTDLRVSLLNEFCAGVAKKSTDAAIEQMIKAIDGYSGAVGRG